MRKFNDKSPCNEIISLHGELITLIEEFIEICNSLSNTNSCEKTEKLKNTLKIMKETNKKLRKFANGKLSLQDLITYRDQLLKTTNQTKNNL